MPEACDHHATIHLGALTGTAHSGNGQVTITYTAQTAGAITPTSGSGQSAQTGQAFTAPLVAAVTDTAGSALPGAPVTFTVTSGSAAFPGATTTATSTTDPNGRATSPAPTAGTTPGPATITATTPGVTTPATFTETVTPATPTSTEDCKNGGYAKYGYKNQGQCIAAVNHPGDGNQANQVGGAGN